MQFHVQLWLYNNWHVDIPYGDILLFTHLLNFTII